MSDERREPIRLRVPHDESDSSKVASWPNPDHESVQNAFAVTTDMLGTGVLSERERLAVLTLQGIADAYVHLTTYELGQETCVRALRGIWRARRAQRTRALSSRQSREERRP